VIKQLILTLLIIAVPIVSAENTNTTSVNVQTNNINESTANNLTIQTVPANEMVRAYQALVMEQRGNITKLQSELEKKDKLLAEYITYKKKNIELQQNISKLNNYITTLKAENELLKQQNEQYKDLITDLINKQSNETKEGYIFAYNEWKKDVENFKTAIILGVVVCLVIGMVLVRLKQRYEIPL
jgi:DNA repair exonuclease SbcCD ATPase subunit